MTEVNLSFCHISPGWDWAVADSLTNLSPPWPFIWFYTKRMNLFLQYT